MRFRTLILAGCWALAAAALGLFSCAKRADSVSSVAEHLAVGAALGDAAAPPQEAALWVIDPQGQRSSYWLRGKGTMLGVAAATRGMVFPITGALWEWRVREEPFALCDCVAWQASGREGECPDALEMGVRLEADLVDRLSGEQVRVPLGAALPLKDEERLSEFRSEVEVIASLGPYLFVRYQEEGLVCGAVNKREAIAYVVFDMENREEVDLLSEEERAEVEKNEQQAAFGVAREDNLVALVHPEELELQAITPWFDPFYGFRLSYLFGASANFAESGKDPYASYNRQILVPAQAVPAALGPLVIVPPVVPRFLVDAPGVRLGGWTPVLCAPDRCAEMQKAFNAPAVE